MTTSPSTDPNAFGELRERGPDLYTIDHPLRLAGVEFGTRTTVVRLSSGGLFVHSPGPLAGGVRERIESLGPVQALAAPNLFHHFYLAENAQAWPEARVFLADGLARKRPALPAGEALDNEPPTLWAGDLEQHAVGGMPKLGEVAFFHERSRTLILTDLAFNFHRADGFFARQMLKIMGAWDRFGPSRLARSMMKDKDAIRDGIDHLLAWNFERIVLGHGDIVEEDARSLLTEAYRAALGR